MKCSIAGVGILALIAVQPPAEAAPTVSNLLTGNDLYATCSEMGGIGKGMVNFGMCYGYISGAIDTYASVRSESGLDPCFAPGVTTKQLVDMVVAYLRDNPAERHSPANYSVAKAVKSLFVKCPAQ